MLHNTAEILDQFATPLPAAPQAQLYRPYRDILRDLSQPLPPECLAQRDRDGVTLTYIPWYVAVEALNHYAPGWTGEPVALWREDDRFLVKYALTIRAAEGSFVQVATGDELFWPAAGQETLDKKTGALRRRPLPGDPSSNACAMALTRAAAMFGLGLWLRDSRPNGGQLAALRAHLAGTTAPTPVTAPATPPPPPPKPPQSAPPSNGVVDRGAEWHQRYTQILELSKEYGFSTRRVTQWMRHDYPQTGMEWSTRNLTLSQLEEVVMQLAAKSFSPAQIDWLSEKTPGTTLIASE